MNSYSMEFKYLEGKVKIGKKKKKNKDSMGSLEILLVDQEWRIDLVKQVF